MKNEKKLAPIAVIFALLALFLCSCGKDDSTQMTTGIQTGDTTVGIAAHYFPNTLGSSLIGLIIKYNYKLTSPVKAVIRFYIHNKGARNLSFTIPANNENPVQEVQGGYLNSWTYPGEHKDSVTGKNIPSEIDSSWDVDSVKVVAVETSNKHYGFKVISDEETWPKYFEIKNPVTSIGFIWNGRRFYLEDYDFRAGGAIYTANIGAYLFRYFDFKFQMFSNASTFPLKDNMSLDIGAIVFFDVRTWGAASDNPDGSNSTFSTIKLKITSVDSEHFSGTFAGKLFSNRQPDTLYITEGFIKNAPMPTKE